MSPDGKDSGSVWQDSVDAHWKEPFETPQVTDTTDNPGLPPLSHQKQAASLSQYGSMQDDDNEYDDTPSPRAALLENLGRYASLILAPLLFGALTCLFVLPFVAAGRAIVPAAAFPVVLFIIILIAVAQGIAVYLAGPDNGLWTLGTLGGFFLFILVGVFCIFGLPAGFITFLLLLAACVALARLYLHAVPEGFVDIVYSMGKYSRTIYPGPNILLPWEKVIQQLDVEETQWICPAQRVQLSRDEDVILRAAISYQLLPEDAYLAVTQVKRWEESLREFFITSIQHFAATFSAEDFIAMPQGLHHPSDPDQEAQDTTAHWDRVNDYLFQQVRDKVALWGVQINWVRIRDVELVPHGAYVMDATPVVNAQPAARAASGSANADQAQPKVQYAHSGSTVSATAQTAHNEDTVPGPAIQAATLPPNEPAASAPPPRLPNEEVLVKAYKEVQNGHITDPETIRSIAEKFEAIANSPELSQSVSFDAPRAALNLYAQAKKNEQEMQEEPVYEEETRPDWPVRRQSDDNKKAGG